MRRTTLTYHPGLDGLRGVAVAAVLLFHMNPRWADGGYLGVSTFFTLSGFLITTLLLTEHRNDHNVNLRRFWGRRFRRLMPAAIVTLLYAALYGALAASPAQLAELRGDLVAALFYVANWHFILTDQSYFDLFSAPSPVLHFWSLAIEEQFYLFFPLITAGVLAARRGSRRSLFLILAVLAALSTIAMALLYDPVDTSRAYYGTGTRAAELLIGALLAILLLERPIATARSRIVVSLASAAALVVTVVCYLTVPQQSAWLYQGGFLGFALVTAILVAGLVTPGTPVSRALRTRPVRALGLISYGVYLYHWPTYLWLDQARTGLDGLPLFGVRLATTLTLAIVSYHLLEKPIRERRALVDRRRRLVVIPSAMALVVLAAYVVTVNPPTDPLGVVTAEVAEAEPPPPPPPQPGVDRPVRALFVGDTRADEMVPALETWGTTDGRLEVAQAPPTPCGDHMATTEVDGTEVETCAAWIDAWTPLVDDFDPDVVLISVADWGAADILVAGGRSPDSIDDAGTQTWLRHHLQGAVAVLGARGAEVTYLPFPHPRTGTGLPDVSPDVFALYGFLNDAAVSGDAVHLLAQDAALPTYPTDPAQVDAWRTQVADAVGPALVSEGMTNDRTPGGTRIMVVGDSVSWFIGLGLEDWSLETGSATVWNAGTWGCGVARGGEIETAYGVIPPVAKCDDWAARWKAQLADFDPDIVVLLTGMWDLTNRTFPDWDGAKAIGDPTFDEYLLGEYEDAVDVLSSTGAQVAWLMTPCYGPTTFPGPLFESDAFDRDRLDHLNQVIVPELTARRPDLETVDLFSHVCPDGKYVREVGGIEGGRPDGVHFNRDAARWIADWLGPELLLRTSD